MYVSNKISDHLSSGEINGNLCSPNRFYSYSLHTFHTDLFQKTCLGDEFRYKHSPLIPKLQFSPNTTKIFCNYPPWISAEHKAYTTKMIKFLTIRQMHCWVSCKCVQTNYGRFSVRSAYPQDKHLAGGYRRYLEERNRDTYGCFYSQSGRFPFHYIVY